MQNNKVTLDTEGRVVWPFPSVNGQQTDQSRALMLDKSQHKPVPFDISTVEESLL
jgi:hypothetical protein